MSKATKRKRRLEGPIFKALRTRWIAEGARCWWCRCELTIENCTVDHRIPLGRGGKSHSKNYLPACQQCNNNRRAKMPPQMVLPHSAKPFRFIKNRPNVPADVLMPLLLEFPNIGEGTARELIRRARAKS